MLRKFPALRRILIYGILSYIALVVVNNSGYELENMWLIYAPMFIAVYIFSRWVDSRLPNDAAHERQKSGEEDWSINILRFTKAITTLTSIKSTKMIQRQLPSTKLLWTLKQHFSHVEQVIPKQHQSADTSPQAKNLLITIERLFLFHQRPKSIISIQTFLAQ